MTPHRVQLGGKWACALYANGYLYRVSVRRRSPDLAETTDRRSPNLENSFGRTEPLHAGPIEQGFDDVPLVQADTAAQSISDFDFGRQPQDVVDRCADIIR